MNVGMYYGHFITKMINKPTPHAAGGALIQTYQVLVLDILRDPVWSRQDADLGMCRVDGVYIVTVCIRAHYMVVWGCSRVASGPFCACAAATATAVLFWWSVWLWSCCGVLGGHPLR